MVQRLCRPKSSVESWKGDIQLVEPSRRSAGPVSLVRLRRVEGDVQQRWVERRSTRLRGEGGRKGIGIGIAS
jgi:hypothetical protein